MKTLTQKINKHKKQNIMLGIIFLCFASYSYAIVETTTAVSSSKMMNQELQEIQTDIAALELTFFELIDDLSADTALAYGLNETSDVNYVERNTAVTVAFNDNL